jgi:HAD domain in Swiss Army Knife RNA repair proteins
MQRPSPTHLVSLNTSSSGSMLSANPSRILFLDMDGVCCSKRATLILGHHCVDPMAVQFLNRLHAQAPYHLVASSSWRREYYLPVVLEAVGCVAPFADPWKIETDAPRPQAIADWLATYASDADFLILDDEEFDWLPGQGDRWIRCDTKNGIGLDEMRRAFNLFGIEVADSSCSIG